MEAHSYSFFGQKTGMILSSPNSTDPYIFLTFVKKLSSGIWEKPSLKQGKNIKCNIGEIIQMIQVARTPSFEWSTVHRFKNEQTSIKWKNQQGKIFINITGYSKVIAFPESQLLLDLLIHIYKEKIEFATGRKELKLPTESIPSKEDPYDLEDIETYINSQLG